MKMSNAPVISRRPKFQPVPDSRWEIVTGRLFWIFQAPRFFLDICQGYGGKNGKMNGKSGYELYAEFSHLFMKQPGTVVLPKARLWENSICLISLVELVSTRFCS